MEIIIYNHIIVGKLLVLDRNTWIYIILCKYIIIIK